MTNSRAVWKVTVMEEKLHRLTMTDPFYPKASCDEVGDSKHRARGDGDIVGVVRHDPEECVQPIAGGEVEDVDLNAYHTLHCFSELGGLLLRYLLADLHVP